ncbi:hypothetical protein pb186bvf_012523 [Paramecium bursaria]
MAGLRHGPRRYKLSRDSQERWHLQRTQVTQLVQHERIQTTYAQAKALKTLAIQTFKVGREAAKKRKSKLLKLSGILTTRFSQQKLINEIIPKYREVNENIVNVVETKRRLGDNARMAYIEFAKNDLAVYEAAQKKEQLEKGLIKSIKPFNEKILQQEREFFKMKLDNAQNLLETKKLESDPHINRFEQDS